MGESTKSSDWSVRPGFAFSAGAGVGAGLYVFDFLNHSDNTIYGMMFIGLGLAGGPGSGAAKGATEVAKKLAQQAAVKGAGTAWGAANNSGAAVGQQYADRKWTKIKCDNAFSAGNLNWANGRVTILGVSAAHHGAYACFVTAASWGLGGPFASIDFFHSQSVDVLPQSFDLQIGVILGVWHEVFSVPNGDASQ